MLNEFMILYFLSSQRQGFTDKGYFNGLLTSKATSVNVRELDLSFTSNSKKQDSYDGRNGLVSDYEMLSITAFIL